jgi:hypothetical protein
MVQGYGAWLTKTDEDPASFTSVWNEADRIPMHHILRAYSIIGADREEASAGDMAEHWPYIAGSGPIPLICNGQAAKEVGLDKSTISRAIKSGKLSAHRKESGGYEIDPAELFRVFSPASKKMDVAPPPLDTPIETLFENRELHVRLEAAELRIRDKEDEIRDLRHWLDTESEERRKLTLMLLAQPQPPQPKEPIEKSDNTQAQQSAPPPLLQQSTTTLAPRRRPGFGRGFWEKLETIRLNTIRRCLMY